MASVLAYVLVLACTALYHCDGMAVAGNDGLSSNWLTSNSMTSLVRHERDITNETESWGEEEYISCQDLDECMFNGRSSGIWEDLQRFRFEGTYFKLVAFCSTPHQCRDDDCKDDNMLQAAEFTNGMVSWMCLHKEGFRDTSCYQASFSPRMQACTENGDAHITECVLSVLDDLPGCSRNNFFATFFNFAMAERKKMMGY